MARLSARARPDRERVLRPARQLCPGCGGHMRLRYENRRTLVLLTGAVRLRLQIRRCEREGCSRYHVAYRPEAEGAIALPQHEFGLDVIALVGVLRHREHRSVPEIYAILRQRGVAIAERSVTNLLDRYDELLTVSLTEGERLRGLLASQGRVILALDGLQPDVGHEVLWVVRDCLSGEVLLARSLLSGTAADLAPLLREVAEAVGVPVEGVISDGQTSIRRAVEQALPGVPHQLCQFHFLREAALPVFEADRHAKVELKKQVRGIRPIERAVEGSDAAAAEVVRGYCAAVRSAITDDGHPPLAASGLTLKGRLEKVAASLDRVGERGRLAAAHAVAPADHPRLGVHGCAMAGHRARLRLGAPGRAHPEQPGRGGRQPCPAPLRRAGRGHAPAPRNGGDARGRHRALPQGGPQLQTRAVPLLRGTRPAADQQRPRASVWRAALPRAPGQWAQGGLPGHRAPWGGAPDRGHGDAAAPPRCARAGSGQPGAMDRTPPAS